MRLEHRWDDTDERNILEQAMPLPHYPLQLTRGLTWDFFPHSFLCSLCVLFRYLFLCLLFWLMPLPYTVQHTTQTFMPPGGIRTRNLSKRAATGMG